MAVVVFLKGINVGRHRRLRPSALARELKRLDVVSIGAAGTFVVRKAIARAELRTEIIDRIPFDVDVMICSEREILSLVSDDPFDSYTADRDIVQFVGILPSRTRSSFIVPSNFPADGAWCLKVLRYQDRFVLGVHRRQMKAITYLSQLEKVLGMPLTVRNWNTILAVKRALQA